MTIRILTATIGLSVAAIANGAPHYSLTNLTAKVGRPFTATAINSKGQIAGSAHFSDAPTPDSPFSTYDKAIVYDGALRIVGWSGGPIAVANSINASGHVTGTTNKGASVGQSVVFVDDGSTHYLDSPPPRGARAIGFAINAHDQVAGYYTLMWTKPGQLVPLGVQRAFFYDGTMHELDIPAGINAEAHALNDAGVVAGFIQSADASRRTINHVFFYDGKLHDIGTLPGCQGSRATAINNKGTIVGTAEFCDSNARGFVYDGTLRALPNLDGPQSTALGINSAGDIVGTGQTKSGQHAMLVQGDTAFDLNAQIPVRSTVVLSEALAISDSGLILAIGTENGKLSTRATYLLTPISEGEAATITQNNQQADADKKAEFLASVDPLSGSGAKITHDDKATTLTYSDAANRTHSYVVVRPKFAAAMMANADTSGWIFVAPDKKSGVSFNVTASGGVSGKAMNPMMIQMMVGP